MEWGPRRLIDEWTRLLRSCLETSSAGLGILTRWLTGI